MLKQKIYRGKRRPWVDNSYYLLVVYFKITDKKFVMLLCRHFIKQ